MNGILENDINIFGLYKKIITKKKTRMEIVIKQNITAWKYISFTMRIQFGRKLF